MTINKLIPKDKGDIETAKKLNSYSYEELKPINPKLMKEFERIATYPTQQEVDNEVQELAMELINKRKV